MSILNIFGAECNIMAEGIVHIVFLLKFCYREVHFMFIRLELAFIYKVRTSIMNGIIYLYYKLDQGNIIPPMQVKRVGEDARIRYQFREMQSKKYVTWQFRSKEGDWNILSSGKERFSMVQLRHDATLYIEKLSQDDQGQYECLVYYQNEEIPDQLFITSATSILKIEGI